MATARERVRSLWAHAKLWIIGMFCFPMALVFTVAIGVAAGRFIIENPATGCMAVVAYAGVAYVLLPGTRDRMPLD